MGISPKRLHRGVLKITPCQHSIPMHPPFSYTIRDGGSLSWDSAEQDV